MSNKSALQQAMDRPAAANHIAQLYGNGDELADSVSRYIAEGLLRGEAVLLVTSPSNWAAFVARLALYPEIDLAGAIVRGQLRIMDAGNVLSVVMEKGMPQWERMHNRAGSIIEASCRRFGKLRIYEEMVDSLWQDGNTTATERLESFWNELAYRYSFTLLCAYGADESDAKAHNALLKSVCRTHSRLLPRSGYNGAEGGLEAFGT